MIDLAIDTGRPLEPHLVRLERTLRIAANNDFLGLNPAFDESIDLDDEQLTADVADDLPLTRISPSLSRSPFIVRHASTTE